VFGEGKDFAVDKRSQEICVKSIDSRDVFNVHSDVIEHVGDGVEVGDEG
jgi:hypothetical protein